MQLPQHLQAHFVHATLIVIADHSTANLHHAQGDTLDILKKISEPRERKQDSEGSFASSDGSHTVNPDADVHDEPRLQRFMKDIADTINTQTAEHSLHNLYLVMPADALHLVKKHLTPASLECLRKELPEALMSESVLNVLERLF